MTKDEGQTGIVEVVFETGDICSGVMFPIEDRQTVNVRTIQCPIRYISVNAFNNSSFELDSLKHASFRMALEEKRCD